MARIHPPKTLFLNVKVADIQDPDSGARFEALLLNGTTPAIRSEQTGRICSFDFRELVELALAEGIDAEAEVA